MNKRIRKKLEHRLGYRTWKGCKNRIRFDYEFEQVSIKVSGINFILRKLAEPM